MDLSRVSSCLHDLLRIRVVLATLLFLGLASAADLPAGAESRPANPNQTVPPIDLNSYLPYLRDPSVLINATDSPTSETAVAWSPDGHLILFTRIDNTANSQIFTGALQDGLPLQDGLHENFVHQGDSPEWSPDSSEIAFSWGVIFT